jgi:hypothetical protein
MPQTPGRADHSAPRPQPVLTAATAASAATAIVGAILTILVATGVIGADDSNRISESLAPAITAIVGVASTIAAALKARQQVTPLASPQNAEGVALVAVTGLASGPA